MGFVIAATKERWNPRQVPFEISDTDFPPGSDGRREIERAIETWNTHAPHIPLIDREPGHDDFAVFVATDEGFCKSDIGRQGGCQEIKCDLRGDSAFHFGNLMHEIGHAIGLTHEHQRPDQADFIKLIKENIDEDEMFEIIDDGSRIPIGIYDYDSIMHYPQGDSPRFEVLQLETQPGASVGQRDHLSSGDLGATLFLYGFHVDLSVAFGATAVGATRVQAVRVINRLPRTLTVTTGSVSGAFFNVIKDFPTAVKAFRTEEAIVMFRPQAAGPAQAQLSVTVAGVPLRIQLSGRGLAGVPPDVVAPLRQ
jgi:Astacin (Peptidase family M12A)